MKHTICLLLFSCFCFIQASASSKVKYPNGRHFIYRLTLRDKLESPYKLDHPTRWLSHRSIERRRRQGLSLDSTDLPVSPQYLKQLRAQKGMSVIGKSRWNNTVLMLSQDSVALNRLSDLPFVRQAECVWISPDSIEKSFSQRPIHQEFNTWDSIKNSRYANGSQQIEMLQGHRLHGLNLRGKGLIIAVLDGGFQNTDRIPSLTRAHIIGVKDFVYPVDNRRQTITYNRERLFYETDHGTKVLSIMAANEPEVLTGTAPESQYWLLRCEDQQSEQPVEEDYWAMAAEFADSVGVDIINSSLGYNNYDTPMKGISLNELDGRSTLISRTASMLAGKGIILVNSAGNTGMGPWKKICVPADAHEILTVGAINEDGQNAPFSAVGPTQDGRIKPDVTALGAPAALLTGSGALSHDMGTSFSTPVVCGLVACLWQALPQKSALDIIDLVRMTADNAKTPNNIYGYGRPNFWRAYMIGMLEEKEKEKE
jgi:hypothetical protein